MVDLAQLKLTNEKRWAIAKLTRGPDFQAPAHKAIANKATYADIQNRTGVPWTFVALTHYRESSQDFTKNLGQGDPLSHITKNIPAGRGPFLGPDAFVDAAVDALVNCAPHAARETDWSLGGMLTLLERYNGLGYAMRGMPSPYLWSGTDQYQRGKFVADGAWSSYTIDAQLGCAGLLKTMMSIDNTIEFSPSSAPALTAPHVVYDALWLQQSLNALGAMPTLHIDGVYGQATRTAVRAFQARHQLTVDGNAGTTQTIPAIVAALKSLQVH